MNLTSKIRKLLFTSTVLELLDMSLFLGLEKEHGREWTMLCSLYFHNLHCIVSGRFRWELHVARMKFSLEILSGKENL